MSAHFEIDVDVPRSLVRIVMAGFFEPADLARFVEARRAAHARLLCGRNQHLTMNDLRGMKIQSQEMVDAFRAMLADPAYRSRRLAFVTGPTLARMQLERAVHGRSDVACFSTPDAAQAWLFADSAGLQRAG
ncbi:STAS/SEC14 domain-containing protein [Sphingosinithalassobacter sp. LHW66-3]|uniref:STAS/SEC14 domain-containing protein n=1 Tax=Sphingosinithalassobacter sp. LHW66-3 TaxID=3424718 RepID=UPI003D6BEAFD